MELVEFTTADGAKVLVQVPAGTGAGAAARPGGGPADGDEVATRGWRDRGEEHSAPSVTVAAGVGFEQAVRSIRPAAEALVGELKQIAEGPDEISVEFGLQMSVQAGAFIAQVGTEANFRVMLTWHRR